MATLPFEPDIAVNASKNVKPKVLRNEFGDGYTQRALDGIHILVEKWNCSWEKGMTDALTLETFLENHVVTAFDWIPPGYSAQKFTAMSWTVKPIGDKGSIINAEIERIYEFS